MSACRRQKNVYTAVTLAPERMIEHYTNVRQVAQRFWERAQECRFYEMPKKLYAIVRVVEAEVCDGESLMADDSYLPLL